MKHTSPPKITFGMIVLNGEPFIQYNLRALYPFAHQIIIVEGAAPAAAGIATLNGHSNDGTLEQLYDFQQHHDPAGKLVIVTAEDEGHPDGFWPGEKHEQSRAYAKRTTGDYIWQVDVDEFYRPEDMQTVIQLLEENPQITAVSFETRTFWGGFDYTTDGWYLRGGASLYHRLFKWRDGYTYSTHRPPTVCDKQKRDLRTIHWLRGGTLAKKGIYMYHYSLVFPKQVEEKSVYYGAASWARRSLATRWAQCAFTNLSWPFHVHNVYRFPQLA